MTAVLDTNVLFAFRSARDQYHDRARAIIAGIDHGDLPDVRIPEYVLAETMNLLANKIDHRTATDTLERLVTGRHFEIEHVSKEYSTETQEIFRQNPHLSYVDASIVAYMRRTGISTLHSFDDDFDDIDEITRLNAAVDLDR